MKKKLLAVLMALCMIFSIAPTAYAANKAFYIVNPKDTKNTYATDTMENVLKVIKGELGAPKWPFGKAVDNTVDTKAPVVIRLTNPKEVLQIDQPLTITDRIYRFELAVDINTNTRYVQESKITEQITVGEGGVLVLSGWSPLHNPRWGAADVTVEVPIKVEEGGEVYLDRNFVDNAASDKYTAAGEHPIFDVQGGELYIGGVDFVVKGDEPAIKVSDGGKVVFYENMAGYAFIDDYKLLIPNFEKPTVAFTDRIDANAESSGGAIVAVASGSTLTLRGGTFTNTGNDSAIIVEEGATIEIPVDSKTVVTAANNDAIDLVDGSIIKKGDTAITVGIDESDDESTDNYVDNDGNIILAKGATVDGDDLNAAIITPDGTIIEGSETEAPTLEKDEEGNTVITVPKNGKVTEPDGTVTSMLEGGTVTTDGSDTEVSPNPASYVASIGDKTYNTLQEAVDAVEDGQTIMVLKEDQSAKVTGKKTFRLEGDGAATATLTAGSGYKLYENEDGSYTVKKKKKSSSSSDAAVDTTYSVSAKDVENGKVKIDPSKAEAGDTVTITVTPEKGYEIDKVKVTDRDGNKISIKDKGNGKYTFTMPDSKVEIKATFEKTKAEEKPAEPEEVKKIILTIDQQEALVFDETKVNDVPPIIRNDRTMLPIRFVAEALGAEVAWDGALNIVTITKDDMQIKIFIGSKIAFVNETAVELDAPAFIENSRTYLPLRFVAENLGATVTWDAETQEVTIIPAE